MPVPSVQMALAGDDFGLAAGWLTAPDDPTRVVRVVDRSTSSVSVEYPDGSRQTLTGQQVLDVGTVPLVVQADGSALDVWGREQAYTGAQLTRQQDADGRAWYSPVSVNGRELSDANGFVPPPVPIVDPGSQLAKELTASTITLTQPEETLTETGADLAGEKTVSTWKKVVPWALIALVAWYFLARRHGA